MSPPFPSSRPTPDTPCPGQPWAPRARRWTLQPPRKGRRVGGRRRVSASVCACVAWWACAEQRECASHVRPCAGGGGRAGKAHARWRFGLCEVAWVRTDDLDAGPPHGSTSPALRCRALGCSWGVIRGPGLSFPLAVAPLCPGGRSCSRLKGKEVAIGGQGRRARALGSGLGSPSQTTCGCQELRF